jgi:hypothetical protein
MTFLLPKRSLAPDSFMQNRKFGYGTVTEFYSQVLSAEDEN